MRNLDIQYKTNKLKRICTDYNYAKKEHGDQMAKRIHMRIKEIRAVPSVEFMLQNKIGRCHQLEENRQDEYAVDLVHPYRLIFKMINNQIQIANILEIVDYH